MNTGVTVISVIAATWMSIYFFQTASNEFVGWVCVALAVYLATVNMLAAIMQDLGKV